MSVHDPRGRVGQTLRARSRLELRHHLRRPVGRQHRGAQTCGRQSQPARAGGDVEEGLAGVSPTRRRAAAESDCSPGATCSAYPAAMASHASSGRELRVPGGGRSRGRRSCQVAWVRPSRMVVLPTVWSKLTGPHRENHPSGPGAGWVIWATPVHLRLRQWPSGGCSGQRIDAGQQQVGQRSRHLFGAHLEELLGIERIPFGSSQYRSHQGIVTVTGGRLDDSGDALSVKRGEVYPVGASTASDLDQRSAEGMPTGELVGAIGEHKNRADRGRYAREKRPGPGSTWSAQCMSSRSSRSGRLPLASSATARPMSSRAKPPH